MAAAPDRKITAADIHRAVGGRWADVLRSAGVPATALEKNRHGPCPMCGGKDRYRFTNRNDRGCYVCNNCAPNGGDGLQMLMAFRGLSMWEAMQDAINWLGGAETFSGLAPSPEALARQRRVEAAKLKREQEKTASSNFARWRNALPVTASDPVGLYLKHRGLPLASYPSVLRYLPSLDYWQRDSGGLLQRVGSYPAMLAAVLLPDGKLVALHQTYLTPDGHKAPVPEVKKWTRTSAKPAGAAVRLYRPGECLCVAEGIETALAVHASSRHPVWAGLSAYGLRHIWIPPEVKRVFIYGDHDTNEEQAGQRAAHALADRLRDEGRAATVFIPERPGADWLDVFNEE